MTTEQNHATRSTGPEDPYDYEGDIRQDLLKGIQCVAFLLEWDSEVGNEDVDSMAALGLSRILRKAAHDAEMLYTIGEVHKAGGDAFSLERHKNAAAEGRIKLRPEVPSRRSKRGIRVDFDTSTPAGKRKLLKMFPGIQRSSK